MQCQFCGSKNTRVADSRVGGQFVRRRRVCESCDARFTTYERYAENDSVELSPSDLIQISQFISSLNDLSSLLKRVKQPSGYQTLEDLIGQATALIECETGRAS